MSMTHAERGRKGGRATVAKHGRDHMSRIGKEGFKATARKLGDNGAAVSLLQKHYGLPPLPRGQWSRNKQWDTED